MKKICSLFAAILMAGTELWAAYSVGDCFVSGDLRYKVTSLSPNTVEVTTAGINTTQHYPLTAGTTSVTIPGNVSDSYGKAYAVTKIAGGTTPADGAFYKSGIQTIKFASNSKVAEIGDYAFYQSATTAITLPASVTTIGKRAFASCTALASVILSEGLTTIGQSAFNGCSSLQSITIPASVNSIAQYAFNNCTALADVTVTWTDAASIPTPGTGAFSGVATGAVVHIPYGTTALYEAKGWNQWFTIDDTSPVISVSYIDAQGESHDIDATVVTNSTEQVTWGEAGKTTWYVVTGTDVELSQGAICAGAVNLILADGAKLTATGVDLQAGIRVSGEGNSLTVYGQSAQSGQLIANSRCDGAGIGGGNEQSGSNITINGGIITATGGDGAGIGGGKKGHGSNITINGGTVTATGMGQCAGIGGGHGSTGSNITINGGTVTAICGDPEHKGSGIGDSVYPIGTGSGIYIASSLIAKAGDSEETAYVIYNPGIDPKTDEPVDLFGTLAGNKYVTIGAKSADEQKEVGYIDKDGTEQTVKADIVFARSVPVTWGEAGKTSWYVVTRENQQLIGAVCQGDVRLILADGAKLTTKGMTGSTAAICTPGITVSGEGNSLTIYGQSADPATMGQLVANGGGSAAGIGGGFGQSGSNITINGGVVTATGGANAAGIGGGGSWRDSGSNITINGGTVTATGGGFYGAGIGAGTDGSASYITINGGTVTAAGGDLAAGIGGTFESSTVSDIFVSPILILKAGSTANPTEVVENTGADLASSLAYMRYVIVTDAAVCSITANQDPNNKTHYYSTFYSSKTAYTVPEGVTAYTGVVEGNVLRLTAIADGIIPAGEPVILRLTSEENTATKKELALTPTTTTATRSDDNAMTGTDEAKTLGENEHALSLGQSGVGFYLWNGRPIGVNKSYLSLDGTASGTKAVSIVIED